MIITEPHKEIKRLIERNACRKALELGHAWLQGHKPEADLYPKVLCSLAEAYLKQKSFQVALYYYEQAIELFPDNVIAYTGYAYTLLKSGAPGAENAYRNALEKFPQDAFLRSGFAECALKTGDYREACNRFAEALDICGPNPFLYLQWARAALSQQDYLAVHEIHERSRGKFPGHRHLCTINARAYREEGNFDAARRCLRSIPADQQDNAVKREAKRISTAAKAARYRL